MSGAPARPDNADTGSAGASRLALLGEALASAFTVGLAIAALVGARPGRSVVGVLVAAALIWSALPTILLRLSGFRRPKLSYDDSFGRQSPSGVASGVASGAAPAFTTVVRVGDEPLEVARTSILLAARSGPTTVVAAAEVHAEIRRLRVPVRVADTVDAALAQALAVVPTEWVLITSARAVPCPDACAEAIAAAPDSVGWVTGETRAFSGDGYVADSRDSLTAALRAQARQRGLVTWEPDATLVRTRLLRDQPLGPRQPWGAWLRDRSREGHQTLTTDAALALRAAPVDAAAYWPDTVARDWARVADLATATASGSGRARVAAVGLLARELFALPFLVWMAAPLLVGAGGSFPFRAAPIPAIVALAAVGALRWIAVRHAAGQAARPLRDANAALHHVPGSLASIGAIVTRKLPRSRVSLPARPLVWAALLLTVVTGASLVDGSATGTSNVAIATSLGTLGLLWVFTMGALSQRNWERTTYRIPLDLSLTVNGVDLRALNGSPSGLAVAGPTAASGFDVGDSVKVRIRLDDGTTIKPSARISGRRTTGDRDVVGLSLSLGESARRRWVEQLARAAAAQRDRAARHDHAAPNVDVDVDPTPTQRAERVGRLADRVVIGAAGVASLAVASILVLVMFGYRPLVIRSGSMEPTLDIGDVVLTRQIPASAVRAGDVATLPVEQTDGSGSLTHRVVEVTRNGDSVTISTKGDANAIGERTILPAGATTGRLRWVIPAIGTPATAIRTSTAQLLAAICALGMIVVAILRRPRAVTGSRAASSAAAPRS